MATIISNISVTLPVVQKSEGNRSDEIVPRFVESFSLPHHSDAWPLPQDGASRLCSATVHTRREATGVQESSSVANRLPVHIAAYLGSPEGLACAATSNSGGWAQWASRCVLVR